jgi:hypothetical protein
VKGLREKWYKWSTSWIWNRDPFGPDILADFHTLSVPSVAG